MTIERLRDVLNAIGPPVTTIQLAEMIWLASHLPAGNQEPEPASDAADTETAQAVEADPQLAVSGEDPTRVEGPAAAAQKRQPLHAPGASSGEGRGTDADTLLVPTAPMLRHPLAVQRALRPLKRRIPSRLHRMLDEAATAARAADRPHARPWIPVMLPARERWLSLALVIDTGPSMGVWQPLASELRETMFRLGAFRDVRVWLLADLADKVGIRDSPRGPTLAPATLINPSGRQAVVLFSDCSGPHWWEGRAGPAVHLWARRGPTAILQPLSEGLWRRTAAPIVPGRAVLARPGAPNTALKFTPHDAPTRQRAGTLPVPVIELSAAWLASWAQLVTASGGGATDTAVTYLTDRVRPANEPLVAERELPVAERLLRFQDASSREAAELAAHIAVAIPALPVMQLIQQRIIPSSGPSDLAEVLLSGLLRPVDAFPGLYDFVPGARAALLKTLPRPESLATAEILEQISAEIQERAGTAARTFQAIMPVVEGTGSLSLGPDKRPFALVDAEALSLLNHTAIPVRFSQPGVGPRNPQGEETSGADRRSWVQEGTEIAGRYVLEAMLGHGGMWETWRASDRLLDRPVAVKVMQERMADTRRFQREARIAARLQHPGITVVHDVGTHDGLPFVVMELLRGHDLAFVLRQSPAGLPPDRVIPLVIQAAEALQAAHQVRIVHRDLKPSNLFLQSNGLLKICDFGIARATDMTEDLTSPEYTFGSVRYMSPEQCQGDPVDARSDLYSLGCVLYALLTGQPPFPSGEPLAIMHQHLYTLPDGPRSLRPGIPADLDRLVLSLLAKDPAQRPADAGQVITALKGTLRSPAPSRAAGGHAEVTVPRQATEPVITATDPSLPPLAVSSRESPRPDKSPPAVKIGLWGPPGSGKTTYLAALRLAAASADRSLGQWGVFPLDQQSRTAMVDFADALNQGRFPDATPVGTTTELRWLFIGDITNSRFARRRFLRRRPLESRFELHLIDVSGEAFGYYPGDEVAPPAVVDAALDHLFHARGLIYLFDPITERDSRNTLSYVNRTLAELKERFAQYGYRNSYLPHHVSICITKFDHPDVFQEAKRNGFVEFGADGMPRVPDGYAEDFFDLLCTGKFWSETNERGDRSARFVRNELRNAFDPAHIEYFVTSSIGFWKPPGRVGTRSEFDPADFANYHKVGGHEPSIRGAINPINVLEPLIRLQQHVDGLI